MHRLVRLKTAYFSHFRIDTKSLEWRVADHDRQGVESVDHCAIHDGY